MEKEYLLSICIPTYNRASVLEKTLESFVRQLEDDIEIVISDNCSTDNTEEVGRRYAERFENIKYFRNEVNVRDKNFTLSLDRGTGLYLKLMKDNLEMTEGSLHYMKQHVLRYCDTKPPLFFTNEVFYNGKCQDVHECDSVDDFIIHTSNQVTSVTFFGCWREQWELVTNRDKYSHLQLSQEDWVYQLLAINGRAVLCTKKIYFMYEIGKRSGYNWFNVHVTNYYTILQPYVDSGLISRKAVNKEKRTRVGILKPQLAYAYFFKYKSDWDFDLTGKNIILWEHFKSTPRFYTVMLSMPVWGSWIVLKYKVRDLLVKKGIWDKIKQNNLVRKLV